MSRRRARATWLTAALFAFAPEPALCAEPLRSFPFSREDPKLIVGSEKCGKCHENEFSIWKGTGHAESFEKLHKRDRAETIAQKLGFARGVKRDTRCLTCHFTSKLDATSQHEIAISGISCESCHGAARGWIDVHNDYGEGNDHDSEPAEHREQRLERSRAAGMRRPGDLYTVASNCFQCHIVPFEELVNVGGHKTGSTTFNFVERVDSIRHNFIASYLRNAEPKNAERPLPRKRIMFVAGRTLYLEYALRALAQATQDGEKFHDAAERRVESAAADVEELASLTGLPALRQIVSAARGAPKHAGAHDAQLAAARQVAAATRKFLDASPDPERLAALDPILAGQPEVEAEPSAETQAAAPGETDAGSAPASGAEAPPRAAADPTGRAHHNAGELVRRVHPPSKYKTIEAQECSECHEDPSAWLREHPHSESAIPFRNGESKNRKIARLYGIQPDAMAMGDQVCMDCHGTVVSGKKGKVRDGVSCQSCHGPAGEYLEPHQEGTREKNGYQRPGFAAALKIGMVDLRSAEAKARTCGSCHYITVARLLAAGHPSGDDFSLAKQIRSVVHWKPRPNAPDDAALSAAWSAELARRGPIPQVEPIRDVAAPAEAAGEPAAADAGGAAASEVEESETASHGALRDEESPRSSGAGCRAQLGDWEPPKPDAPPAEQLAAIQRRLRELYRSAGEGGCL